MARKEHSFGIIPVRKKGKGWQTLLVKHGKGHWAFPKGHPDSDEKPEKTAAREFGEETGLQIKQFMNLPPLDERYFFRLGKEVIEKSVTYYIAEVEGTVSIQKEEIADFRWLSFKEAIQRATFRETKALIHQVSSLLKESRKSSLIPEK